MWAIYPQPKGSDISSQYPSIYGEKVTAMAAHWDKRPSFEFTFNALDPSYNVSTSTDSLFDSSDEYFGLPRDDAGTFELVDAYCTACHSLSIVMQQRATSDRWAELLEWMEKKQGMAPLPAEDGEKILAYVTEHFSVE